MTDSLLNILKYALLALLYLFFARVLWAVWSEVRGPRPGAAPVPASTRVVAPSPAAAPVAQRTAGKAPKGKRGAVARLVVLEPKVRKGTAIGLANEVTFGRSPGCTISVPDDTFVSQVHARVFNDQGSITIEDLGSTNGTYVNGNRISAPLILSRGDRVQVGATVLEAD
ncbi:unannotated protein [freshwater metagenome]|uniref:Unannotated protein n=1 Tax=freshwater metagenome TaxID=449393 RepID=A0A6J7EXB9_9ZZZZ